MTPLQQQLTGRCAAEPDCADGGGGRGAAGTLRQPGEPFAFARGRAGPRGGDSHGAGSEPVAAGATIAGGNERAGRAGRRSGFRLRVFGIATAAGGCTDRPAATARSLDRRAGGCVCAGDFGGHGAAVRHTSGSAQRLQRRAVRDAEIHQLCERRGAGRVAFAKSAGGSRGRPVRGTTGDGGFVSLEFRPADDDSEGLRYRTRTYGECRAARDEVREGRGCEPVL